MKRGMTPERWQTVRQNFLAIAALPDHQRSVALDQARIDDPDLALQVTRMLAHDRNEHSAIEDSSVSLELIRELTAHHQPVLDHQAVAAIGVGIPEQIGEFRVLRHIGLGTSGVVLEARQSSPDRRVAIKLLHPGVVSREIQQRFQREADVLARLNHPGIAGVYLASVLPPPDKRPYIVLEYVEGESLSTRTFAATSSIPERLELMARICDAVQYAHTNRIIHRDLKPDNIVVTPEGQPKVLDFGIAMLVDAAGRGVAHTTLPGQVLGSVLYMSPEQAGGKGHAGIDTRTDVYALGAITFHLLSGRAPIDAGAGTLPEILGRVIRGEIDPISRFVPAAAGDIEAVVHKALSSDRRLRYQSASELAAELRRAAHGEPVLARPLSATSQLVRLAARHPRTMVAAAVVVAAGLIGVVQLERTRVQAEENFLVATRAADVLLNQALNRLGPMAGTVEARRRIVQDMKEPISRLASARPENANLQFNVVRLLDAEGDLAAHDKEWHRAILLRHQALGILDELCAAEVPDPEWIAMRSITLVKLGDARNSIEGSNAGIEDYRRALQLDLALVREHPANVRMNDQLYWSYQRLAANLRSVDPVRAKAYFEQSRVQAETLLAMSPDRPGSMYVSLTVMAEEAVYRPGPPPTESTVSAMFEPRLALGRRLVQLSPANRGHVMLRVRDLLAASKAYAQCGLYVAADSLWDNAKALSDPMLASDSDDLTVLHTHARMSDLGAKLQSIRGNRQQSIAMMREATNSLRHAMTVPDASRTELAPQLCLGLITLADALSLPREFDEARKLIDEMTQVAMEFWITSESPRIIREFLKSCTSPRFTEQLGVWRVLHVADAIEAARPDSALPSLLRAEVRVRQGEFAAALATWEAVSKRDDACGEWAAIRLGGP